MTKQDDLIEQERLYAKSKLELVEELIRLREERDRDYDCPSDAAIAAMIEDAHSKGFEECRAAMEKAVRSLSLDNINISSVLERLRSLSPETEGQRSLDTQASVPCAADAAAQAMPTEEEVVKAIADAEQEYTNSAPAVRWEIGPLERFVARNVLKLLRADHSSTLKTP